MIDWAALTADHRNFLKDDGLHLTDAGVAFLTGIPLALFYVTFGLPISWFADRSNRRNILASALVIWSAFTVLCGMSRTYWQFLLGRIGVGVCGWMPTRAQSGISSSLKQRWYEWLNPTASNTSVNRRRNPSLRPISRARHCCINSRDR